MGFINSSTVGRSKREKKLKQQTPKLCELLNLMSNPTEITFFMTDRANNKMIITVNPVSHYILTFTKKTSFDLYLKHIFLCI